MIEVHYRTKELRKVCERLDVAIRKYGLKMAEKIHIRIDQIRNADNVLQLVQYEVGRCHKLRGNREGQFSMDLVHPYRLIFIQEDDRTVTVRIEEITDYH